MPFDKDPMAALMARGVYPLSDHTQPDMADGGAAFGVYPHLKRRAPSHNAKTGEEMYKALFVPEDMLDIALMLAPFGKVGKLLGAGAAALSPMEAEAGKVKTGVDLARRSLFGLRPTQEMKGRELVPLEKMREELARAERAAPKVEQKTTTVTPSPNAPKVEETLKSVAETPVSRRTVLKSASGQVMRHALPGMDELSQVVNPMQSVVRQAAQSAVPLMPLTMQGLIAKAAKMGLNYEDTVKMLSKHGVDEYDVQYMLPAMRNPYDFLDLGEESLSRAGALSNLIGADMNRPMTMRGPLREILRENPEMYRELRQAAKDIAEYGYEP